MLRFVDSSPRSFFLKAAAVNLFIALTSWIPLHWSRLDHLTGGSALQRCLDREWIGYDLAVFRRPV